MQLTLPANFLGRAPCKRRSPCLYGFSLVELMIAITLGMLLLAAVTTIFARNSATRNNIERVSHQADNGLYAITTLADDMRNAGYLSSFNPQWLPTPSTKPDPCTTDLSQLRLALPLAVQGYDNGADPPSCINDVRTGTDIVVVRRAAAIPTRVNCTNGDTTCEQPEAGAVYFQASACNDSGELASQNVADYYALDTTHALPRRANNCVDAAPVFRLRTHIYYVANNNRPGDGIPTLKRAELGADGFSVVALAEGVENLQVEWGIDDGRLANAATTGVASDFFNNIDAINNCAPAVCANYWRHTVAARIGLLVRTTTPVPGHVDNKTYLLGDQTINGPGDRYARRVFNSTVRLYNPAGRGAI